MINHARLTGGLVRKDPVDTIHPLVRVHPVTGEKCLFLNGEFLTKIPGLKESEQKWLLEFLIQHIVSGHDFQARVRWQPRTIVIFDNRCTLRKHHASPFDTLIRLMLYQTPQLSTISTMTTARNCAIFSAWPHWLRNPFRFRVPTSSHRRTFVQSCSCSFPLFIPVRPRYLKKARFS